MLARVLFNMKAGEAWADLRAGSLPPMTRPPLVWEADPRVYSDASLASAFADELRAAGYSPATTSVLFEDAAEADLQIGAIIEDLRGRFCQGCIPTLFDDDSQYWTGEVVMSVQWQVYSPLERRVVATVRTSGGATQNKKTNRPISQIVYAAFQDNVRRLLAAREFHGVVLDSGVPAQPSATLQQPSLATMPLRLAAPARRPIGDTVSAVATVFSNGGHGSAFLISADGHLLTNQHVVGESRYVKVRWHDGTEELGEILRVDRGRDVALIKVAPTQRAPLAVRNVAVQPGEAVFAIGTPLDEKFQNTVTRGVVSASRVERGRSYIQSDVVISPGNSGGPLLDESGQVLGISVMGVELNGVPAGINLFIPIGDALAKLALIPAT